MNNLFSMMQMMSQIKENPMKLLSQRFNLPENIPHDPQSILEHLVNSGQISKEQISQAMQMKNMFMK